MTHICARTDPSPVVAIDELAKLELEVEVMAAQLQTNVVSVVLVVSKVEERR